MDFKINNAPHDAIYQNESPEKVTNLVCTSISGDAYFVDRLNWLVKTVVIGLCHLRDKGQLTLSREVIRSYLSLEALHSLYLRADELPDDCMSDLKAYLNSIPGMNDEQLKSGQFSDRVRNDHGFLIMVFIVSTAPLS